MLKLKIILSFVLERWKLLNLLFWLINQSVHNYRGLQTNNMKISHCLPRKFSFRVVHVRRQPSKVGLKWSKMDKNRQNRLTSKSSIPPINGCKGTPFIVSISKEIIYVWKILVYLSSSTIQYNIMEMIKFQFNIIQIHRFLFCCCFFYTDFIIFVLFDFIYFFIKF